MQLHIVGIHFYLNGLNEDVLADNENSNANGGYKKLRTKQKGKNKQLSIKHLRKNKQNWASEFH